MAITKELSTSIVSDLEILFDEKYYNAQLDVTAPNNAYEHFITVGQFKGISPHPFFDLKRYSILFNIPAEEALRHFFTVGINNNYSPHFLINLPYLKREILQHQELKEVLKNLRQEQNLSSTLALLSVFEKYGNQYQLSPSPYFDTTYYLRHLTIDIEETENAFCHFIKKGRHQTLDIVPEIDLEYYALKYKIESTDSVEILWELFCNFSHIRALNKHANLLHVFHRNLAKSFSLEDLITPASKSFMLAHGLLEETNELIEFHFLEINHTVFDDIKFQEVTFSDPIIYSGVGQLNLKGGTCKLPIPTLKRFNNCLVIGSETGLITQEKYINLESSLITKKDKYYVKHGGAIVEYVGKKDKIDKVAISYAKYLTLEIPEAILLCHTYCFNYFHF